MAIAKKKKKKTPAKRTPGRPRLGNQAPAKKKLKKKVTSPRKKSPGRPKKNR